jgi:hypothetical protein
MTTKLTKPVYRQTETSVRDLSKRRLLIAGLLPGDVIQLRLKGCRKSYLLSVESAYLYAAKLEGERLRRERKMKGKQS